MTFQKTVEYFHEAMDVCDHFQVRERLDGDKGTKIPNKEINAYLVEKGLVSPTGRPNVDTKQFNFARSELRRRLQEAMREKQYQQSGYPLFAFDVDKHGESLKVRKYYKHVENIVKDAALRKKKTLEREVKNIQRKVDILSATGETSKVLDSRIENFKWQQKSRVAIEVALHNVEIEYMNSVIRSLEEIEHLKKQIPAPEDVAPPTAPEGADTPPPPGDGEGQEESHDTDPPEAV